MQQSSTHTMCDSTTNYSDEATLAGMSQDLLAGFQEFLAAYTVHTQTFQGSEQEHLLAEFGRLRVWIEQTGASLHGRESLDENLQNDSELRKSIIEVLQQIMELLRLGRWNIVMTSSDSILFRSKTDDAVKATETCSVPPCDVSIPEPSEEVLTSDSEYSEEDAGISNGGSAHPRPKITRVTLLMSHIREQIELLYHYSAILRRPRLGGRYLHSKSNKEGSAIPPYETSHVRQKLDQWNLGADRYVRTAPKTAVHTDIPESSSTVDEKLLIRLAAANDQRRDQLRYWSRNPWIPEEQLKADSMSVTNTADETVSLPAPSEGPSQSTFATVRTFSSVAKSDIFETRLEARPERTEYANSEEDGYDGTSLRVPRVPVASKAAAKFECPYCHTALESSEMQDRNRWKSVDILIVSSHCNI